MSLEKKNTEVNSVKLDQDRKGKVVKTLRKCSKILNKGAQMLLSII